MANEPEKLPDEQAADLAALQAAAGAVPLPNEPAPDVDPASEAEDLIRFIVFLLVPFFPSLEPVYTPAAIKRLGGAAGPLMSKYGFTLSGFMDQWKEEIAFLLVAGPLIPPTIAAVKADMAAMRVKPAAAVPEPPVEGQGVANE